MVPTIGNDASEAMSTDETAICQEVTSFPPWIIHLKKTISKLL
jgi:hypothetical protein